MHFARFAGFHHQADRRAQTGADQMMMHGGAGQQRRDRNPVRASHAVGQDDDVDAFAHRAFGTRTEFVEHLFEARRAEAGMEGGVERARHEMAVGDVGDRADLFQIGVGQDRLAHFEPLGRSEALQVEQVRPRSDDGNEAHHQFFADRIDRRIGDLREVLLEIGEQRLRPVRQRRDRGVVAHRSRGFLADRRHRRHQNADVFLRIAERLLAVEQRQVGAQALGGGVRQFLQLDLGAAEPLAVRMALGKRRLDLVVRNQPSLLEVDQQHLAGLQPPLGDDLVLGDFQHAHFGRHHDAVVLGDEIARRPQSVAVERGADLAAVGEGDRGGAVPRLHHRGVIFVEGAALLVHQGIAGPGFRNHHHHGVRQRVAALHQEFERVVEARRIGLALIGDRPQPADVLAVEFGMHRSLPRRHPVDVAAQRVDFAVMRHHPVRMRQRPGREGVGREALMHQRQRAREILFVQIGIILAELVGEEHALVDDGAAGHRRRIITGESAVAAQIDRLRDRLAQDVEPAFEVVLALHGVIAADEYLHAGRLGRLDGFAERGIVGRHIAPAEQHQPFLLYLFGDDALDHFAPCRFFRHEQGADGIVAGIRQLEADLGGLALEEGVRNLDQDAGAVAGARIRADRAAMFEVAQDVDRVGDDLMRLHTLDVGDEADAAGILFQARIVQALGRRTPAELARRLDGNAVDRFRSRGRRQCCCPDGVALEFRPAHLNPLNQANGHRFIGAPWAFAAPTGPPLVLREPKFPKFRLGRSTSLRNGLACTSRGHEAPRSRCNPRAGTTRN